MILDMEPKVVNEFISEKWFDIAEAREGELLLRCHGGMFNPINIDIVFRAVLYVELPFRVHGIRLSQPCNERAMELEAKHGSFRCVADNFRGELVYAIESQGERYHVVASNAWVYIDTLPPDLTPVSYLCGDEIWDGREQDFETYIKEFYKIEKADDSNTG